ncbi:MAG TPA: DNA/RNA nuclease SfsA [Thermodesulfovibrionales bacterium]|jgi:sugar fermentation stimulation protein A|nr:DNA/RNA nuclease SfsA [Thermodesulfovibrionales bacterium]
MTKDDELRIFGGLQEAFFLRRPNRFIVECMVGKRKKRAYLPNPGRLWELLFPGVKLFLSDDGSSHERRTAYTVAAVEKEGVPVMLHTHETNTVARWLIERNMVPGLEGYRIVRPEVACGKSRFDFLLEKGGDELMLEVKSCTLFKGELAMFPDAATERGRRHLMELAELASKGKRSGVLFIVHSPSARYFMPEYHTDLPFSQTLFELRKEIFIKAVGVEWRDDLTPEDEAKELRIPWNLIGKEARDCGNYILILHLKRGKGVAVGGLGVTTFQRGYYLYIGSAKKNLTQRIKRHKSRRKRLFWHVDYLREKADFVAALPIRSSLQRECEIARALREISDWTVPRFGSSDCLCESHLFGMAGSPVLSPRFIKLLQYFRMDCIAEELKGPFLSNGFHAVCCPEDFLV